MIPLIKECGCCPAFDWSDPYDEVLCKQINETVTAHQKPCAFVRIVQRIMEDALDDLDLRLVRRGEE